MALVPALKDPLVTVKLPPTRSVALLVDVFPQTKGVPDAALINTLPVHVNVVVAVPEELLLINNEFAVTGTAVVVKSATVMVDVAVVAPLFQARRLFPETDKLQL